MDSPQEDAALEQEAPALKVSISGSAAVRLQREASEEYPLMMLCVMDVMGPGCRAAWWQASPLATLEDKLAASRFSSPSTPLDLCGEAGPIVILDGAQTGHTTYSIIP